jgi:hypothetical protein
MLNYYSKGRMAQIERSQLEADHLGDEEAEPVTRETLRQERRELIVVVACLLGVALVFFWLLIS